MKALSIYPKTLIFLMAGILLALQAVSQAPVRVKGTVTDATNNSTLIGVNVVVKGSTQGTVTNFEGRYELEVKAGSTLVFSYIGYTSLEEVVTAARTLDIRLKPDVAAVEEVLVIGYGTQKKTDRTGSVVNVKSDEMNRGVLTDPIQAIQGKAAGVMISKKGGDPNSGFDIKIRGASSLVTSTSPLYVVDGVPGVDPTTIAPEDIESFNILKDASAAAIYGSRGANGVIIITTKRGKEKKGNQIEVSAYQSTEVVANRLKLLNADQIRSYVEENNLTSSFIDGGANTDWQDEIFRTGQTRNLNLAISGGDDKSNYRTSLAHTQYDGVVIGTAKTRTIGRLNIDQKALNDKLQIQSGLAGTIESNNYIDYSSNGPRDVLYQAYQRNPTDPVFDSTGAFYQTQRDFQYNNPVALVEMTQNQREAKRYFGFLKADLEIVKGLTAGVNLGYTRDDSESFRFEPSNSLSSATPGYGRRSYSNAETRILETTLRYKNSFDLHNLEVVGGYSWQQDRYDGFAAEGEKPFIDYVHSNDLSIFQTVNAGDITSYKNESKLISFFGRAIYNFNSKYYLTATVRRDGSSKFGKNNMWGIFPSASAMWNVTSEDFMASVDWLNSFKMRVGYGITGNQEIGMYHAIEYWQAAGNSLNFETGEEAILFQFAHSANPDLKWEENAELNIGFDFGILNDKISGSIDYFKKNTHDLLGEYSVPVPPYPVSRIWANAGEIEVSGFEFNIQTYPVRTKNFDWKMGIVFSTYKQEVISLSKGEFNWSERHEGWLSGRGLVGDLNWTQIVKPGFSLGSWYMPEFAGIGSDGKFRFYTEKGGVTPDLSKAQRRLVGDAQPDFELGWSNYFTLNKNFDMSMTWRMVYGYEVFNTTRLIFGNPIWLPNINVLESALEEVDKGLKDNPKLSSYYLEDASFLRLDNLSLGYNFRNVKGFTNIRVYFASNNLLTITKYSGIDPEISHSGISFGLDQYNVYPKTRTFTLGVNFTL